MGAYLIADVNLHLKDPVVYEEYRKVVPALIQKHGGRYLVRGGTYEVLEGDWKPGRLIVLEFPSMEHARGFYESEEYRAIKPLRADNARSNLVLVEGL